ncbi:phage tail protein [uncultured Pseudomonas sp.]|uniref:phage tail protein n=1 Tax=uncultured Pseudomonas sp. TaxID=114707 RepID=UPI0025F462C0|nr:phage tail protein [uncultured Pseudomonas sp.]
MGAVITLAGESLIAQKQAANTGLKVSRFIFANVSGLNPTAPVDRAAPKPVAAQIVYTHQIPSEHAGYVNPNQVVYSAQIGSDVGDWDFNWIGLETVDGVLFAVAYVPVQQKRRNIPPQQIGNNLTRNFLVVFDGAQALTGVTIDAKTWQHDFTVRLAGIDERARKANRDLYGRRVSLNSGLLMEKVGNAYQLKPGTAYIEGLRVELAAALLVAAPPSYPTYAWLDISLQRQLNDVVVVCQVAYALPGRPDYVDSNGITHYSVLVAELPDANTLVDRRIVIETSGALLTDFALKKGDYPELRARATKKEDVGLGNIPNAISDDSESNSSSILATTKAVKAAASVIWTAIANIVSGVTVVGKAARLAVARRITVNGAVTGSVEFDGSGDVILTVSQAQASESVAGTAKVSTQPQTDAGVDDSTFISPKKLRWGFAIQLAANGYIVFPTWLGGLILQWGTAQPSANTLSFPIAFPRACVMLGGTGQGDANSGSANTEWMVIANIVSNAQFRLRTGTANVVPVKWHAIGY